MRVGLTVVVNPRAGGGDFGPARVEALRRVVGPGGSIVPSLSEEGVDGLCADVIGGRAKRVGIIGGDGTSASVITGLWRAAVAQGVQMPEIALLRGGTMNTVANALHIAPGPPERLIATITSGAQRLRSCNTLQVDGRLGFLLSTGVMYGFLNELYGRGRTGTLPAAVLLARSIGSTLIGGKTSRRVLQSFDAALQLDDRAEKKRRYVFVGAGTVDEVGLGFRLFPRARDTHSMHVVAFHGRERALALAMPALSLGRCAGRRDTLETTCGRMVIDTGGQSVGYSLDGDLYRSNGDLTVAMGPRLRMVLA